MNMTPGTERDIRVHTKITPPKYTHGTPVPGMMPVSGGIGSSQVRGRRWLVLIAIDRYAHPQFLPSLKCCIPDAELLRDILSRQYGFVAEQTIRIYNEAATERQIRRAFEGYIMRAVRPEDEVVISYSGHGHYDPVTQLGRWFAQDAEEPSDGILNSVIRDWCKALLARHVLILADSCFSGSLLVRAQMTGNPDLRSRELITSGGLHPVADAGSPDGQHSVFNYYLCRGLERLAERGEPFGTNQLYVSLYDPVYTNAEQEPQHGVIYGAQHEGGQFIFHPVFSREPSQVYTPPSLDTARDLKSRLERRRAEMKRAAAEAFYEADEIDQDPLISPREKQALWAEYLEKFRSTEHELEYARERLEYWRDWKPPRPLQPFKPPVVAAPEPAALPCSAPKPPAPGRHSDEAPVSSGGAASPVAPASPQPVVLPSNVDDRFEEESETSRDCVVAAESADEFSPDTLADQEEQEGGVRDADEAAVVPQPPRAAKKSNHAVLLLFLLILAIGGVGAWKYHSYQQEIERERYNQEQRIREQKLREEAEVKRQQQNELQKARNKQQEDEKKEEQKRATEQRDMELRKIAEDKRRDDAKQTFVGLQQKDADKTIASSVKAAAWKDYLDRYGATNHEIAYAEGRLAFWTEWKPSPTPSPTPEPTKIYLRAPSAALVSANLPENDPQSPIRYLRERPRVGALLAPPLDLGGGITMNLVYIRGGTFTMGSPSSVSIRNPTEGPQTVVGFSRDFWMGETEVTQQQWLILMDSNPSSEHDDLSRPVNNVSWNEALRFCEKLTEYTGKSDLNQFLFEGRYEDVVFTLPTEAQWEYACRAGSDKSFCYGDGQEGLGAYAWFLNNSDQRTRSVKTRKPNKWNLHDMHGNVWEWCLNWRSEFLPGGKITDWQGPASGSGRVLRGGSAFNTGEYCRSAYRLSDRPDSINKRYGFRVVGLARSAMNPQPGQ